MQVLEDGPHGNSDASGFYSTDGVPRINELRGSPFKSTTRWDGNVLELTTTGKFGDNQI